MVVGGAPTATVITDGTSNAIFPDISELDRAGGRVNLRKLHVSVQTMDTDTYMGSNIIVSEPPADPNVSVTVFSTRDTFDRRDAASARVESYLTKGPMWGGMLLENHIAGQRAVQILQALDAELPRVGQTLVLVQNEGASNEKSQYIRTTEVSVSKRKFEDSSGKMVDMNVVTCWWRRSKAMTTEKFPRTCRLMLIGQRFSAPFICPTHNCLSESHTQP